MENKKILVVGMGDEGTQDSLMLMLNSEGYNVSFIKSGNEAFENIVDNRDGFDAIIIEPNMSEQDIDGFKMIEQIREAGIINPIIALSNRANIEDKVRGLNAGADAYLVKPFYKNELIATIGAQINGLKRVQDNANSSAEPQILARTSFAKPGMI